MLRRSVVALALLFAPLAARADGGEAKATADVLFEQAKQLMAAGHVAEACPKFAESLRLDSGIGTMLYLAECWERLGRTASAWAQFREAQTVAHDRGDAREEIAGQRAKKLEPSLARVVIEVPSRAPGLKIERDGLALDEPTWGAAVPVDPGPHRVAASAPDRAPWSAELRAEAGKTTRVTVPVLAAIAAPVAPPPAAPPREEPHDTGAPRRTAALVAGAVGVVAIGAGLFFGARAKTKFDASNADGHCDATSACDDVGFAAREDARSAATASTVLVTSGLVVAAVAVVLYVTAPRARATSVALSF